METPCSYYGSLEPIKPKATLVHFMLDEHIKKTISDEKDRFKNDMKQHVETLLNSFKLEINSLKKYITKLSERTDIIEKSLKKVKKDKISIGNKK